DRQTEPRDRLIGGIQPHSFRSEMKHGFFRTGTADTGVSLRLERSFSRYVLRDCHINAWFVCDAEPPNAQGSPAFIGPLATKGDDASLRALMNDHKADLRLKQSWRNDDSISIRHGTGGAERN